MEIHICYPRNRKIWVQASMDKKLDPVFKITRAKRAGGVAQVVMCLPPHWEALSSNPTISQNKNKKQAFRETVVSPSRGIL
jgi:hypothetical protein